MTDLAGAMVQLYAYDAYGNAIGFDPAAALTEFLYSGEQFDAKIGQQYLRQRYYDPSTGRFNRLDPFFGNHADPQSFHKYAYVHADPVNGIDPNGKFAVAISIAIAAGISANIHYRKSITDISKGYLAFQTGAAAIAGYMFGLLAEMAWPYPIFGVSLGKPSYRVTQDDINYALRRPLSSSATPNVFSLNNRKILDNVSDATNRENLLHVLQIVRNTNIDRIRTDTCNTWVAVAATRIALLGESHWKNSEYIIEQVWYEPPQSSIVTEHAVLRITFTNGQVAYFDNGALGDTSVDPFWNQRITGGIGFTVPSSWEHKQGFDKGLDDIDPVPGRLDGLSILFQ